jgi:hypothetical protein
MQPEAAAAALTPSTHTKHKTASSMHVSSMQKQQAQCMQAPMLV